jgi:hypothetical protein
MIINDQPSDNVDKGVDQTAVTSVFNLRNVLELVDDTLNRFAITHISGQKTTRSVFQSLRRIHFGLRILPGKQSQHSGREGCERLSNCGNPKDKKNCNDESIAQRLEHFALQ